MTDAGGILLTILFFGCLLNLCSGNKCSSNPCLNEGICTPRGDNGYECSCTLAWIGTNCEKNKDECQGHKCENGGTCKDEPNFRYTCNCTKEFTGQYCELRNPCLGRHKCKNGATCVPYPNGEYLCDCKKPFMGTSCEERIWACPTDLNKSRGMCNGNGQCGDGPEGTFVCVCDPGYAGDLCQDKLQRVLNIGCFNNRCFNKGKCIVQDNGISACKCPKGYSGSRCEVLVTEWNESPRRKTSVHDDMGITPETLISPQNNPTPSCRNDCLSLSGNGICEQQCNTALCQFDGGDCDPWKKCKNKRVSHCRYVFRDGKCNPECNSVDCLFDGQDCDKAPCINKEKCSIVYQNNICNEECNNPQCGFDGGDCHSKHSDSFFSNVDVIRMCSYDTKSFELDLILMTTLENFQMNKSRFLQTLGSALKMVLTISNLTEITFNNTPALSIKLNINPTECIIYGGQCFSSLDQISSFIKAGLSGPSALALPFKVANVDSRTIFNSIPVPPGPTMKRYFFILIAMITALIISFIFIGVLLRDKWGRLRTKVKTAGVWTPSDGYSTSTSSINSNNKSGWSTLLQTNNVKLEPRNYDKNGALRFDAQQSSRLEAELDGIPDITNRKRRYDVIDLHDKALTFQAISDNLQKRDGINPIGSNQAKLLSFINDSLQVKNEQRFADAEDGSDDIGSYVNEVGESALHIAARMNCGPNLIKKLHHASPSMLHTTDEWGRTPLASAAASDSYESVEQLLLLEKQSRKDAKQNKIRSGQTSYTSCRTADSPVKATTGLIESVKLNSTEMITLLLDEGSPVNVLDSGGRSVVHWAALFNNVNLLDRLSHMKIFQKLVDLKDNEEKSPLYLAASEGAFEAVKFIVEYMAKLGIKIDQMYPCPLAIAVEKGFRDIELLISEAQLPGVYTEKAYKRLKHKDTKLLKKLSSPTHELGVINEYKEYSADSLKLDKNSPSGLDSIDSCLLDMYSLEDSSINNILDSYSNERNNYSSFKPMDNNCHSYLSNTSSSDMSPPLLTLHNPSTFNGYNGNLDNLDPALQHAFFLGPDKHTTIQHATPGTNNPALEMTSDMYRHRPFNLSKLSSINCPL